MADIATVLLAAGSSSRMGAVNKLTLPVGDGAVPMVRAVAIEASKAAAGPMVVVTGHDRESIERALRGLDVEFVHNPEHEKGQALSVLAGMDAVPAGFHVMVALADQPALDAGDLAALLECHSNARDGAITVPFREAPSPGGQRGNPIVLTPQAADAVRADRSNPGCRSLTEREPDRIHRFETSRGGFFVDVDTPEAYQDFNDPAV